jgi:hypothetical protein
VDREQSFGDMVQIRRIAAVGLEQRLAFDTSDARIVLVDVDDRLAVAWANSHEEGATALDRRDIASIPLLAVEEQVFATIEAEQCNGLKRAILILAEQDRIFALNFHELGRDDEQLVDGIAKVGAVTRSDPQCRMFNIVQDFQVRHARPLQMNDAAAPKGSGISLTAR